MPKCVQKLGAESVSEWMDISDEALAEARNLVNTEVEEKKAAMDPLLKQLLDSASLDFLKALDQEYIFVPSLRNYVKASTAKPAHRKDAYEFQFDQLVDKINIFTKKV